MYEFRTAITETPLQDPATFNVFGSLAAQTTVPFHWQAKFKLSQLAIWIGKFGGILVGRLGRDFL